jgi:RND family efflux transporter MFP subunit
MPDAPVHAPARAGLSFPACVVLAASLAVLGADALAQGRVIRITTARAESSAVEQTEWAVGVIESRLSAQVAAEVTGTVVRVLADEGQGVRAGQVLAEIETQQYQLGRDADQAEAGRLTALLKNKQMELDRARKLVAERLIAAEQVDGIESELDALTQELEGARARVAESGRRLGKTRVTAPVDAEIAERLVDSGDFVQAGTVAFDLVDVQHLRVKLPFPEYRAPSLRVGQKVRLSSAAAGSGIVTAAVTEVRPSVNPANRSITVIVDFDNPGGWRPGASVRADVVLAVRQNAVTVPQVAIVRRPVGDVVYVINDGKAEERPVKRGLRSGKMVEVLEGLKAGEVVAVDGAGFLTQGGSVDVAGSRG